MKTRLDVFRLAKKFGFRPHELQDVKNGYWCFFYGGSDALHIFELTDPITREKELVAVEGLFEGDSHFDPETVKRTWRKNFWEYIELYVDKYDYLTEDAREELLRILESYEKEAWETGWMQETISACVDAYIDNALDSAFELRPDPSESFEELTEKYVEIVAENLAWLINDNYLFPYHISDTDILTIEKEKDFIEDQVKERLKKELEIERRWEELNFLANEPEPENENEVER